MEKHFFLLVVHRCSLSVQAAGPRRRRRVSRRDRSGGTRPLRRFHEVRRVLLESAIPHWHRRWVRRRSQGIRVRRIR